MMNIETLLQAAQILESQQSVPPKKRIAIGDTSTNSKSPVATSILSSTTINTNPTTSIIVSSPSLLKNEQNGDFPQRDLNLNFHHQINLAQQCFTSNSNNRDDDDDDDDDDEIDETNNQNVNRTNDTSNRTSSGSCFRDREIHNRLEKHRRAHLKDCFDSLKAEVPCQRDRKITNLQVLNLAIKYIQTLTRKDRQYNDEVHFLTSRNVELQQKLNSLKSELNSQGHQVDCWLESCSNDVEHSISTQTASEAEMYRTFDENYDQDDYDSSCLTRKSTDSNSTPKNFIDSKVLSPNHRKLTTRSKQKPAKRKLQSIPTSNILQPLSTTTMSASSAENLLDFNVARHLHLDEPCNLLTNLQCRTKESLSVTPITDIRYEIVDMFTKGTNSSLQSIQSNCPPQISPLPSIASLMNRHSSQASPIVSPTKQTIGINTDPLTTSTTNILHQPVATS